MIVGAPQTLVAMLVAMTAAVAVFPDWVRNSPSSAAAERDWTEPVELSVDSARRLDLEGDYPLYSLALGSAGNEIHLFTSASPYLQRRGASPSVIEHLSLPGQVALGSIEAVGRPIRSMTTKSGPDDHLYLLWAEEEGYFPDAHPQRLYLNEWTADDWLEPRLVSDPKSRPGINDRAELDLYVDSTGAAEVCWVDWREEHFWFAVFNSGDGRFPKIYCASSAGDQQSAVTKVQKRGRFSAHSLSVVTDNAARPHLVWREHCRTESRQGYADVFQSARINGRWSPPTKISDNRDYDGTPGVVHQAAAARGRGDIIHVAWIWAKWLNESQQEHVLEVRNYVAGRWSEGTIVLSRRARHVRWASGQGGTTGLVFQEYPHGQDNYGKSSGHALWFVPIDRLDADFRVLLAPNTVPGVFDATVTPDKTTHLVYMSVSADRMTGLQYRCSRDVSGPGHAAAPR